MKNQLVVINNKEVPSCKVCHESTIQAGWCEKCIDVPENKYTCNPVQTQVYNLLSQNPEASFVVASKTGTGKTWTAYMAIQKFFATGKTGKVVWINPLKQIAREKSEELHELFSHLNKKVLELTGDTSDDIGFGYKRNIAIKNSDIIVTSQEMFDSLTRKPDIYTATNDIGLLIIDEIHGIGDNDRGAKLDGAVTRFMLRAQRLGHIPQVVALSATFDNINDLKLFFEQFVPTFEIVSSEFTPIKANVDTEIKLYRKGSEHVFLNLLRQYIDKPGGILCMQLSIPGSKKLADLINAEFGEGTARVHFSELARDEKNLNVDEFNEEKFKVLCCTPTLLAGVNVAATVIILNVTFFNPQTMEMAILPSTAIRQASGRVGRPPRYNEGWVSYLCQVGMEDRAELALRAPNTIIGAMRSALEYILNLEISLQSQTIDGIKDWYQHTYSGFNDKEISFDNAIEFLTKYGYIENQDGVLVSTKKGKSVAKNFVNPLFFEHAIAILEKYNGIQLTEQMVSIMGDLFSSSVSPLPWTQGKEKNIKSLLKFEWMRKKPDRKFWDWSSLLPQVQWADSTIFTMERVQKCAEDLELINTTECLKTLNYSLQNRVIPVPLVRLGMYISSLGLPKLGCKYLLYLHLNGVTINGSDVLEGPDSFRTPWDATYDMRADKFAYVRFNDYPLRYRGAADGLKKYYNKPKAELVPQTINGISMVEPDFF